MDIWDYVRQNAPNEIQELIVKGEVDVNERNDYGETALHLAATYGYIDVIQVLLAHHANVYLQDWESQWTALHRSVYNNQWICSLLLLRHVQCCDGRQAMKKYLYTIQDASQQSVMEMLSTRNKSRRESKGMVYTFGTVDFQLGYHLPHLLVQSSPRGVDIPSCCPIIQISANKYHTVVVNNCGQVYVWGFGKGGRLGIGTEYDCIQPMMVKRLEGIVIAKVAAGENHTLALSMSGQVFSWGSNHSGQLGHALKPAKYHSVPKRIERFRGMHITHIAASVHHSAAIGKENSVIYTWGSNKHGQLGRKEGSGKDQAFSTPQSVDRLVYGHALSILRVGHESIQAIDIVLSEYHTSVLLSVRKNGQQQGQVWQFGGGSDVPSRIVFPTTERSSTLIWRPHWQVEQERNDIVAVSSARTYSVALSATGAVFIWGHPVDTLSHNFASDPQRVVALDRYARIVSICASLDHCAAVTRDGDLVTWKWTSPDVSCQRVEGAKKVAAVAAGHQHTVLLVSPDIPVYPHESLGTISNLQSLVQARIAEWIDLSNVATVWKYANLHAQTKLETFCMEYMQQNGDALLEMGSRERFDLLFELILPPVTKTRRQTKHKHGGVSGSMSAIKTVKAEESVLISPVEADESALMSAIKTHKVEEMEVTSIVTPIEQSPAPPVVHGSRVLNRKKSSTKFISVNEFFAAKKKEITTCGRSKGSTQWKVTSDISPAPGHSIVSTPTIPIPVECSVKPEINRATPDRPPGSTFSLDAFIVTKKTQRKKSRSDGRDSQTVVPFTPWMSHVQSIQTKPTLKEIQEEEKARLQAEERARAKYGGTVRKLSTINSWGHVETVYESLVDLQKREEEERLIEEQRQILAQIQWENEQRKNKKKNTMNKENTERENRRCSTIKKRGENKKEHQSSQRNRSKLM